MKKERLDYYEEFIKSMQFVVDEVNLTNEVLRNFNKNDVNENLNKIHTIEHGADIKKHSLMEYLLKDFMPPIEREDIIELSHKIDDVTDNIEEILINFYMLDIGYTKTEIYEYLDLLIEISNSCNALIKEFKTYKKSKKIFEHIKEINNFEEKGDELFMKNMRNLYLNENEGKEIMIWTKIYNCFEKCYDSCEKVADCVETIILKNS